MSTGTAGGWQGPCFYGSMKGSEGGQTRMMWYDRMNITDRMLEDGHNLAMLSDDWSHVIIQLTRHCVALIDFPDWDKARHYRWSAMNSTRATRDIWNAATAGYPGSTCMLLHRLVMDIKPGNTHSVVRVDTNGIDCRRANLRVTDGIHVAPRRPQSTWRGQKLSSSYHGVSMNTQKNRDGTVRKYWTSWCTWGGKQHYLGSWPGTKRGEKGAAIAHDEAVRANCAAGARTNFPC